MDAIKAVSSPRLLQVSFKSMGVLSILLQAQQRGCSSSFQSVVGSSPTSICLKYMCCWLLKADFYFFPLCSQFFHLQSIMGNPVRIEEPPVFGPCPRGFPWVSCFQKGMELLILNIFNKIASLIEFDLPGGVDKSTMNLNMVSLFSALP